MNCDNEMALISVEGFNEPPSLEMVAMHLNVSPDDIDRAFGVVLVNPNRGMYCVQIRSGCLKTESIKTENFEGPWADPQIDTCRPV